MTTPRKLKYVRNVAVTTTLSGKKRYHCKCYVRNRQRYATFSTMAAARTWLEHMDLIRAGIIEDVTQTGWTIREVFEAHIRERKVLGRTEGSVGDIARSQLRLEEVLGAACGIHLTTAQIHRYITTRREAGVGNRNIRKELQHLRAAIRRATHEEPRWLMPELEAQPILTRMPTDAELVAVYKALKTDDARRAWQLGILTGMRPTDLFRATPDWLDFDPAKWAKLEPAERTLTIRMKKRGGREHKVYVVKTLASALDSRLPTLAGISSNGLKGQLWRGTKDMEHRWHGPQHLRRVVATWLAQTGDFSDEEIGTVLGHASDTTARRHYIKDLHLPTIQRALEAVEKRWLAVLAKGCRAKGAAA